MRSGFQDPPRARSDTSRTKWQTLIDALPGAFMGAASAISNSQSGWIPPDLRSFIVSSIIGAVLSAIAVRIANTQSKRTLLAFGILLFTIATFLFGQNPRADDWPPSPEFVAVQEDAAEGASSAGGADAGGADRKCARFQLGKWSEIEARPQQGWPGSESRPLRVEAQSDTTLTLAVRTVRPEVYDSVLLQAQVVEPLTFDWDLSFGESVDFTDDLVEINDLRVGEDSFFAGLQLTVGDKEIPIPYGVIQLRGGFSDDEDDQLGCPFLIHVQLVSKAWSSLAGKIALSAMVIGALALLLRVTSSLRKNRSRQDGDNDLDGGDGGDDGDSDFDPTDIDMDDADSDSAAAIDEDGNAVPDRFDDRRLGVEAHLDGTRLPSALVRNKATDIFVSIANPDANVRQLTTPFGHDFDGADSVKLIVKFKETTDDVEYPEMTQKMRLHRDPDKDASVEFEVTPTGSQFSAMITVFTDEESPRVLQAARLTALVMEDRPTADSLPSTYVLMVVDVASPTAVQAADSKTGAFVHDGHTALTGGTVSLKTSVDEAVDVISRVTTGLVDSSKMRIAIGTSDHIHRTLLGAAIAGYKMRHDLGLEQFDDATRVQVVSLNAKSVLPVELVYQSKGAPQREGSEMCPVWEVDHKCTTCAQLSAAEQAHRICPSLFWGVTKVVEHHVPSTGAESNALNTDFGLRPLSYQKSPGLTVPKHAILGMSEKVVAAAASPAGPIPAIPPELVNETLVMQIQDAARLDVELVENWEAWRAKVGEGKHDVLIAMPHNEAYDDGGIVNAALEIGHTYVDTIEKAYVAAEGDTRPPLVLLIGCNTGSQVNAFASFAAGFSDYSPYVIATIGEILAVEAPIVVQTIMHHLRVQASRAEKDGTIGKAVRDARLELLGKGHLAGLQLIVHGDGTCAVDL